MVERRLAKAKVAGSSPVIRSRTLRVRISFASAFVNSLNTAPWPSGKARVCKTLIPGPIPGGASKTKETRIACLFCFGGITHESDRAPQAKRSGIRFAYPAQRSGCLHTRRRAWVYSPKAKYRVAPRVSLLFWRHYSRIRPGSASEAQRNPVRIPRPKIGVLAHQAQGVGIFAEGEIPGIVCQISCNPPRSVL